MSPGKFLRLTEVWSCEHEEIINKPILYTMSENNADRVKKIIVSQLNVSEEQVTPEASFIDDLGADSLDQVELVMALEEEFDTEIPEEEAEKLQTVGSVVKYVEANLSS